MIQKRWECEMNEPTPAVPQERPAPPTMADPLTVGKLELLLASVQAAA